MERTEHSLNIWEMVLGIPEWFYENGFKRDHI